uniref:Uncharacterized protein n=1 Tax=Moniliophthora roreri TaxID=221103 RepID=A0A0W0G142_MONRR
MPEVQLLKHQREIEEEVKNRSLTLPRDLVKRKKQMTIQPVDVLRARLPKKKGKERKKGQQQVISKEEGSNRVRGVNNVGDHDSDSDTQEETEAEGEDGEKSLKKRKKTNSSRKTTKHQKIDSNSASGPDNNMANLEKNQFYSFYITFESEHFNMTQDNG